MPVRVMYRLVIPSLNKAAKEGNHCAIETLDEMVKRYAEWLEDSFEGNMLEVGNLKRKTVIPHSDGYFNTNDIGGFGYPTRVRKSGKFYYQGPREDKSAAFRGRGRGLGLFLSRGPSIEVGGLGVRYTKFFSE